MENKEKPTYTPIRVTAPVAERVEEYMHKNRLPSRSAAVDKAVEQAKLIPSELEVNKNYRVAACNYYADKDDADVLDFECLCADDGRVAVFLIRNDKVIGRRFLFSRPQEYSIARLVSPYEMEKISYQIPNVVNEPWISCPIEDSSFKRSPLKYECVFRYGDKKYLFSFDGNYCMVKDREIKI
jgi:hypothetical protein